MSDRRDITGRLLWPESHTLYRLSGPNFCVGLVFNKFRVCVMAAPSISTKTIGATLEKCQAQAKKLNYTLELVGTLDSM